MLLLSIMVQGYTDCSLMSPWWPSLSSKKKSWGTGLYILLSALGFYGLPQGLNRKRNILASPLSSEKHHSHLCRKIQGLEALVDARHSHLWEGALLSGQWKPKQRFLVTWGFYPVHPMLQTINHWLTNLLCQGNLGGGGFRLFHSSSKTPSIDLSTFIYLSIHHLSSIYSYLSSICHLSLCLHLSSIYLYMCIKRKKGLAWITANTSKFFPLSLLLMLEAPSWVSYSQPGTMCSQRIMGCKDIHALQESQM